MFNVHNIHGLPFKTMAVAAVLLVAACSANEMDTQSNQAPGSVVNTATNPPTNIQGDAATNEQVAGETNTPVATTTHARVQQQIMSAPLIMNALAQGQSVDFNAADAQTVRRFIEGKMFVHNGQLSMNDGLNSIDFTLVNVYCTGGKFVMFKSSSESFFNADLPSELNPLLTGETNSERIDGVWETAVVTGVNEDGTPFSQLNIMNMFDYSVGLAQSGQVPEFPLPNQGDIVDISGFILTPEGQALAPDADFWMPIVGANEQGVLVAGQDESAALQAAPADVCS